LNGHRDDGSIDNLSLPSLVARHRQKIAKAIKQRVDQPQFLEALAKAPNGGGIGNRILDPQTKTARE